MKTTPKGLVFSMDIINGTGTGEDESKETTSQDLTDELESSNEASTQDSDKKDLESNIEWVMEKVQIVLRRLDEDQTSKVQALLENHNANQHGEIDEKLAELFTEDEDLKELTKLAGIAKYCIALEKGEVINPADDLANY